jgi:predicted nucleic acid-binding protein
VDLFPKEVARATSLRRNFKVLSTPDTFAFSVAEARRWTLLTEDLALRRLAEQHGVEMHGLLWIIEEFELKGVVEARSLHRALTEIHARPRCRLSSPDVELILARLV